MWLDGERGGEGYSSTPGSGLGRKNKFLIQMACFGEFRRSALARKMLSFPPEVVIL